MKNGEIDRRNAVPRQNRGAKKSFLGKKEVFLQENLSENATALKCYARKT